MSHVPPEPEVPPVAVQTPHDPAILASRRACQVCGKPLGPRLVQKACSAAFRARLWRDRQTDRARARDDGLRAAVETVIRLLQEALTR